MKRNFVSACILALAISMSAGSFAQLDPTSPWPMFRHDAAHTAANAMQAPSVPGLLWSFNPVAPSPIPISGVYSTATVSGNGNVYVGAFDSNLYCLTSRGAIAWSYATDAFIAGSAAIGADGSVYVGSLTRFYRLTSTGSLIWRSDVTDLSNSSPAIGSGGMIYIGSDDNNLYAATSSGSLSWSYKAADYVDSSPAVGSDGQIYVGSDDNNLYVLLPNGALSWSYATGDYINSSAVLASGKAYVASEDNVLYALSLTGSLSWSYNVSSGAPLMSSSPAVTSGRNLYVASSNGAFNCLTPNGSLAWSYKTSDPLISGPVVGANDVGYVGGFGGVVHAFNANGTLMWTYEADTGYTLGANLALGNDKRMYLSSLAYFGAGGGFQCIGERPPSFDLIPSSNSPAMGSPFTIDVAVKPVGGAFDAWAVILAPGGKKFSFYLNNPSALRKGMYPLILNVPGLKQPFSKRLLSYGSLPHGTAGTYTIIGGLVPAGRQPTMANAIPDFLDVETVVIH